MGSFNGFSRDINNGVYRAGFAKSQEAYDGAVFKVFDALNEVSAMAYFKLSE